MQKMQTQPKLLDAKYEETRQRLMVAVFKRYDKMSPSVVANVT